MCDSVPDKLLEALNESFEIFDTNGDGEISCLELHQVLLDVGKSHTIEQVNQMVKRVDKDGNGTASFQEVIEMIEE